eukprot:CAMPEP_0171326030 /NCGR_PEP_ID=MMETSP0816-20121228/117187_1 /TAXON_ID=420281 /ORGANISM="Proboscia inermis, Strain CCAP1064/1" /LENGTH=48 /DNA_ID= /DNA_START= /DNA_END= /DNA_ORIENTATION=
MPYMEEVEGCKPTVWVAPEDTSMPTAPNVAPRVKKSPMHSAAVRSSVK